MSWQIDPAHSHIQFSVRHMMITKVRGYFEEFQGTVDFDEDNPTDTRVNIVIDAASISTRAEDRDNHLRSPDFFDVATFPHVTFVSKHVEKTDEKHGKLVGDLTIRDVTNEVTLDVLYTGTAVSPWGSPAAGFEARTIISRKDWNLNWNQALEAGGWLVGDKITIDVELQLMKVPEQQAVAS